MMPHEAIERTFRTKAPLNARWHKLTKYPPHSNRVLSN